MHVALGIPTDADDSDDWLASREQFVMSYNPRLNVPNWVAWHLDEHDLGSAKRTSGFHSDTGLPKSFYVVRDHDYAGSGYDRGHLCPSADRTQSPSANLATFVLTNVHPQLHALNAGPWEKLELQERAWARAGKELFVVAGGIFDADPERIGKEADPSRRLAVPVASYKIIVVVEKGQRASELGPDTPVVAVVMPNRAEVGGHRYDEYETSVRDVERRSGYDFLDRLPAPLQEILETRSGAAAGRRIDDPSSKPPAAARSVTSTP